MHEYIVLIAVLIIVFWLLWYKPLGSNQKAHHILLFYRDGCPFCDVFKPEWSKIEKMLGRRAKKYNTSKPEVKQLADQYNVSGVPSIILIDQNGRYENYLGSRNADSIMKLFT